MACIVCKINNAVREMKKHPNAQTIFIVKTLLQKIRRKDPKDIKKICEDCRNPLRFNNILTSAGVAINDVYKLGNKVVHSENNKTKQKEQHNHDHESSRSSRKCS